MNRAWRRQDSQLLGTSDLPVEQPMRYYLLVNPKTAKTLGLIVPQSLQVRATS